MKVGHVTEHTDWNDERVAAHDDLDIVDEIARASQIAAEHRIQVALHYPFG
jgi:hypothetical protein